MSSPNLTPFAYEVLALVGSRGASAHDLKRMARKGRIFAWAGESQYYTEPKRLAGLGYLDARTEPGRTRPRTVYTINRKGRDALRRWASTPARFPTLRHEGLVRLLATDLVGEEAVRKGLAGLRAEIVELARDLELAAADADALPHRRTYLLLGNQLARRWLELNRDWLDEVERALSAEARR